MMPLDMIEKIVLDLDYSPLTQQESNKVCAFLNLILKKAHDKAGLRLGVAYEMLTFDQNTNIDEKDAEIGAYMDQIIPIFWQRNCLFSFYFYGYFQTVILKSNSQVKVKGHRGDIRVAKISQIIPKNFELASIRHLVQAGSLLIMLNEIHIRVIRHATGYLISKVSYKRDKSQNLSCAYSATTQKLFMYYPSKPMCSISMADLIKLDGQCLSKHENHRYLVFVDDEQNIQKSKYPSLKLFDDQRLIILCSYINNRKMYFRYKISAKKDKLISIVDLFKVKKAVEQLMTNDQKSSLKLTNNTAQGIGPNHIIFYTAEAGLNPNNFYYIGLPLNNKIHDLS